MAAISIEILIVLIAMVVMSYGISPERCSDSYNKCSDRGRSSMLQCENKMLSCLYKYCVSEKRPMYKPSTKRRRHIETRVMACVLKHGGSLLARRSFGGRQQ
ncbi:hypothetical protein ScPMuIL_014302 [Solemya velum]